MTREEAEKYAESMTYRDAINNLMRARTIPYRKATFIKINELLDRLEQEPCEDTISIQAVIEWLKAKDIIKLSSQVDTARKELKALPHGKPQQKTGYWIRWYEQKETERCIEHIPHCKCSECGKEYDSHSSQFIKYCSECGAKMSEVEE